jgi:hypothetical protein
VNEFYLLENNGKFYKEGSGFTVKESDATKYEKDEVNKKRRKLQKKTFGNIMIKIVK